MRAQHTTLAAHHVANEIGPTRLSLKTREVRSLKSAHQGRVGWRARVGERHHWPLSPSLVCCAQLICVHISPIFNLYSCSGDCHGCSSVRRALQTASPASQPFSTSDREQGNAESFPERLILTSTRKNSHSPARTKAVSKRQDKKQCVRENV